MFRSAATKLAHNSTIPALGANNDLRPLQDLILAEKQVLNSLQRLSSDVMKNAEALRIWGSGEGDDLGDILGASATLLTQWSSALSRFSAHEQPMREHLKVIRTREENLDELKRRRKSVGAKAEAAERKLNKMGAEHKNATAQTDSLNALRAEIRSMDSEIMTEEAALGDFKRTMTRVWMGLKFGALLECSEKGTIAAEYGKLIIGEIVEEQTQPGMARSLYYGRQKTENLLSEAYRCINDVVLSTVLPNPSPQHFFPEPEQKQFAPPNLPTGYGMQGATQLPVQPTQSAFQIPELTSHNEWQPQSQPQSPFLPRAEQSHNPGDQHPNLPVPQGSGTGQFSEQPDSPAHFDLSHQHQRYPSQPAQPHSPPYTVEEPAAPPRSVDDFGINTNSFGQMDMGSPGQGASARFATFPVKHRSYQLADPQAPPGQESESFSMSVAQALSSAHGSPGTVPPPKASYEIPPPQRSPQLPQGHAPETAVQGGPSGRLSGRLSLQHEARGSYSDDEEGLAYDYPHHDDAASPRNKVGMVQDADSRLETRSHRSNDDAAHNPERQVNENEGQDHRPASHEAQPPEYEAIAPVAEVVRESHIPQSPQQGDRSSTTDGRFQHQRRVPPPVFDPAEEERSLNAAAAREVSREMDALTFNPPIPQQDREHTHSVSSPNPGYGAQPNVPPGEQDREHSVTSTHPGYEAQHNVPPGEQLAPPSAPYSGAPSSNTDSPVLPYPSYKAQPSVTPGEQLASPSTPYSGAPSSNTDSPVLPYTSYKAQPNVPPGEQLAPPSAPYSGAPSPNTDSPVLPYPSYNAPLTMNNSSPYPPGPIQQQPSRPSVDSQAAAPRHSNDGPPRLPPLATQLPSGPYSNPNTAPGEYPRSLGAFPGPAPKSTSSLTASGPPGARTISASAFKRPQRVPSNEPPSTFSEVSPLSIKKRIPSSPYPNIREGSPSRPSRSGSGSPARPPAPPPSQALPPVPKDDGNYDYASAYADSGAPQEATAQRERKQSGYGDGRFSTDLERPLR